MKTSPFAQHICLELEKIIGSPVVLEEVYAEFGGSINESFCLLTSQGKFFLKRNVNPALNNMFAMEALGLSLLKQHSSFIVPGVITYGVFKEYTYILLEYMEKENSRAGFWQEFGQALAQMHQKSAPQFGLEKDNFIGSLYQSNSLKDSWSDFFVGERIVPMVSIAHEKGRFDLETVKRFEKLCFKIPDLFPNEVPALLHGDLWSGNFLCNHNNKPVLFDPAVYYGHREMDLAMMQLFGGFHADTYKAYNEVYPLEPSWKERVYLWNLYPLLVHVNLFGGNYVRQVKTILTHFGA